MQHGHMCASTSSSSRLLVYLFLLSGRSRSLHEIAVSAFPRSPLGRADTFSFQYLPQTPCISPSVSPFSPYLLALAVPFLLSFLLRLSCTHQTYLKIVPLLGLPLNPSLFSRLGHLILFQLALLSFSPIQPYQPWLPWLTTPFLTHYLLYVAISTFSHGMGGGVRTT